MSVVGKLYGLALIEKVRGGTESAIEEERVDQVFAVRHVCKKYLANVNIYFGG